MKVTDPWNVIESTPESHITLGTVTSHVPPQLLNYSLSASRNT